MPPKWLLADDLLSGAPAVAVLADWSAAAGGSPDRAALAALPAEGDDVDCEIEWRESKPDVLYRAVAPSLEKAVAGEGCRGDEGVGQRRDSVARGLRVVGGRLIAVLESRTVSRDGTRVTEGVRSPSTCARA